MRLERFAPGMAARIAAWPAGPGECAAWCSAPSVTSDDVTGWSDDPSVEAWALVDDGSLVAYGEIWVDDAEQEVELGHLIVAPDRRGEAVGRRLVGHLAERGASFHDTVVLRVRSDNRAARRCYAAAGFVRVSADDELAWNVGQPFAYVWMRLASAGDDGARRAGAGRR